MQRSQFSKKQIAFILKPAPEPVIDRDHRPVDSGHLQRLARRAAVRRKRPSSMSEVFSIQHGIAI